MLQALAITLREGVEAALIIGITLAYLSKIGRNDLRRVVYSALGAAVVASIALAILLGHTGLKPELFEGTIMLVAAFFVVTMIGFMAKAAKTLRKDIEARLGSFASAGSRFGLWLFVFLMIVREGAETVLVLAAVDLTTNQLLAFLGTVLGIGLSVLFAVMFIRGTVKVDLRKFFKVTTVILVFVAIQLTISGLHELSEGGYVHSSRRQMALIGPIVRNDIFFFVTMLALAALMVLFESRHRAGSGAPSLTRAEERKAAWSERREKLWTAGVYVTSFLFIIFMTAQFIYTKSASALSPATPVTFTDGKVTLDASDMQNGDLRRYSAQLHGKEARFLLYRKPDGKLVTVMDACAICGPIGFYNHGVSGITCKNCDAPVNPQSVGDGGGCNPIPLVADIQNGRVVVSEVSLVDADSQIKE